MKSKKNLLFIVFLVFTITAYSQIDSLENRKIYNWKLDPYDLSLQLIDLDTSLTSFQNFNPLLRNTISNNYLGNLGSAAQSKIYYDRKLFETGFVFSEPYGMYFHLPKEQLYFNTKKQFTLFNFSNGGPKEESEQVLGVLHTQNVNKDLNFGLDYDQISSKGRYQNQEVKQNKISIFSSYQKKGYRLHTNFGLNRVKAQENGGIDSLHYLGIDEYKNRRNIPVRLDEARTQVFNTNFYLAHEYRFGKIVEEIKIIEKQGNLLEKNPSRLTKKGGNVNKGEGTEPGRQDTASMNPDSLLSPEAGKADSSVHEQLSLNDSLNGKVELDTLKTYNLNGFSISHEMIYNKDARKFFDDDLSETFYDSLNIYIDSLKTHDEVKQKQFGNKFSLHYQYLDKFSSRLSFYDERMNYQYNIRPDTTFSDTLINPIQDTIIQNNVKEKFNNGNVSFYLKTVLFNHVLFSGYGEYFVYGYKKENTKVDLKFAYLLGKKTELSLEGKYSDTRPDYFYENYTSNNFQWSNSDLQRIKEWNAGFYIRNAKYKLEANIKYGQITNHLYLDSTAFVNQYSGQINIIAAELSKRLKFGPVNSVTRFVYQKSSHDSILNLPKINLYQSLYYERLIKFQATDGRMLLQLGVDYRFTSNYMSDGYMPTTGMFYRQFKHEQVDHHCFDVFVNVTIKRARFYVKYHYLNSAINKNYYFTGAYYPSPEPLLKFGLAWTFYD